MEASRLLSPLFNGMRFICQRATQPPLTGNTCPTKLFAISLRRYAANSASSRAPTKNAPAELQASPLYRAYE